MIKLTKNGVPYHSQTVKYNGRACIIESYTMRFACLYEPIFGLKKTVKLEEIGLNAVDLSIH